MNSSIFNISNELQAIINEIIDSGGEVTTEIENALEIKESELAVKSENYGYVIKSMEYDVSIVDAEIKRLQAIKKVRANAIDRLKNVLSETMIQFEVPEIVTPTMKINFRKSTTLEIIDEDRIPKEYKKVKVTTSVDKMLLKDAIKDGISFEGIAELKTNQNLQIK
jgi:hypothetical protein